MGEELGNEQHDVNEVNEEIRQLDHEWGAALARNDLEALDRIMPDVFTYTDTFGEVLNKSEFLKVIKRGELTFEILKREDAKLSVHWNTALATGSDTVRSIYKGHDVSGQYRFTNVYVEQGGRWKIVSSQVTQEPAFLQRMNAVERQKRHATYF